jgi:TRAP-type C4-dicarboxylate transport system substrate-binding protein
MSQIRKIRWVLDHKPIELFVRTARAYDEKIRELTNNTVQVEIYTAKEYSEKFFGGAALPPNPLTVVDSGDAEVTQVEIQWVGAFYNSDFFALEMPYLFRDHDHATRVLDGAIGKNLLDKLEQTGGSKGLAFTYSGGYRVFASNQPIMTADDFKQITCVGNFNPVRVDTVEALGCNVVPFSPSDAARPDLIGSIGTVETTLPRYELEAYDQGCNHIIATDHSMFLTSILVNKDFFASLTAEQQTAMQVAADHVSKLERQWTVAEAEEIENDSAMHKMKGIKFHKFADAEIDKLKDMVKPVYNKYRDVFSPCLIDNMISA